MRHRSLDLLPRHARGQHGQRVAQIDHVVQAGAKKVLGGGISKHQKLPETDAYWNSNWEFWLSVITPKHQHSCGLWKFCRVDDIPGDGVAENPRATVVGDVPAESGAAGDDPKA
jgi:hypothetical protein